MNDFLLSVLAFIAAISVLIAVHEFGHYWVARRVGVKVLRFSIGFGKPIWQRIGKDADRVEYVIAALPLGGYVKMLDEREGDVAEEELDRAFNRQPVAKRTAIVLAGPFFNLIFAVVAFWLMFMAGIPGIKPVLGPVPEGSIAAAAGMQEGLEIVSVNGVEVKSRREVLERLVPMALMHEKVVIEAMEEGNLKNYTLMFGNVRGDEKPEELLDIIGIEPVFVAAPPWIKEIAAGSPAEKAGLSQNDRITAVNGVATPDWRDVIATISQHPGIEILVTYERDGISHDVAITPRAEEFEGRTVGRIGATPLLPQLPESLRIKVKYGLLDGVPAAFSYTWENIAMTFKVIGGMLQGTISTKQISGVVTIAVGAKDAAMAGLTAFLWFLGMVSLSLGVLNLLPIPVLDGGHLLFYVVESVKGSPVSERTEMLGQRIGLALILALMTLALYNDVVRLAG